MTTARARSVFPALDGLRIVAVTAVVATHAAFWTGHYSRGTGRAIWSHLDVGVPVFFVISGFLISREWLLPSPRTGGLPSTRTYAWRRAARILPAYWATLVVVLLTITENRSYGLGDWLRQIFLLQIYGDGHLAGGFTQTWSLCTEVSFYALLPGLAWLVVRMARTRARVPVVAVGVAVMLSLLALVWNGYLHTGGDTARFLSGGYWLPSTLDWFMAGTALAAVRLGADDPSTRQHGLWQALDRVGDSAGVCVLVALCAFAVAITPVAGDPQDPFPTATQIVVKNVLYLVVGLALVAPAVLGRGRGYDAVLGHPVMRYLGRISYAVFLVHLALLEGIANLLGQARFTGNGPLTFALTWVVSVAVAAVVHRYVEQPALRFARRRVQPGPELVTQTPVVSRR